MRCDGCLGGGPTPSHVPKCAIKLCAAEKTKTGRCSECAEFPCGLISDFNNDGVQHHSEVLANLRQLRTAEKRLTGNTFSMISLALPASTL